MNTRPVQAVMRTLVVTVTALLVLMGAHFTAVYAQDTLIVGVNGVFTTIEAALAAATSGDTIEVHGGIYSAPLVVNKTVNLIGIDQPVIDGRGVGSLVLINAPQVVFSGFIVRGTGQSLPHEDTGIVIQGDRKSVV